MDHAPPGAPPTTGSRLPPEAVEQMRAELPRVAEHVVAAIIDEVPSYTDAFSGPMGETIRNAVQLALGGFLSLASGRRGADAGTPTAPAVEGAYQLGRGEARSGRSTEALLAAYRIGARVSWREMSMTAVRQRASTARRWSASRSWSSPTSTSCRPRASPATPTSWPPPAGSGSGCWSGSRTTCSPAPRSTRCVAAAERAGWEPPKTLTAVIVPGGAGAPGARLGLARRPCRRPTPRSSTRACCCWCPTRTATAAPALLRTLADRGCLAGPARPWLEVRASYDRALRARAAGLEPDTEAHLVAAGARRRPPPPAPTCAPSCSRRSPTCGPAPPRSSPTRCARGCCTRAGATTSRPTLFVHPQTVRYRMGQLRELYGDRLDDPETVLALTVALG